MPVKEREQESADVRTVHVGISHDNDFVVPQLFEIKRSFAVAIADAGADSGDHSADFVILEHFVQPGFLDVYEFATNG